MQVHVEDRPGPEPVGVDPAQGGEQVGGEGQRPRKVAARRPGPGPGSRASGLGVGRRASGSGLGVGVLEQEPEQLGGPGEPPEREGAQQVARGVGVFGSLGEDVGDPADHGVDVRRVARGDPGDDVAQPGLVGPGQGHEPAALLGLDLRLVGGGVGLDDLGLDDAQHPARGLARRARPRRRCRPPRPRPGTGRGSSRRPGGPARRRPGRPGRPSQLRGRRCRRSSTSAATARAESTCTPRAMPELAQGELADPRGALPAEPDQPVGARRQRDRGVRAGVVARVGGLQVAPVPHQPQVVDLHRPPAAHDQLQTRERVARVEVGGGAPCHAPIPAPTTDIR